MTQEDAKDYLPHVEALRDGELEKTSDRVVWHPCHPNENVLFTMPPDHYRRRPKKIECWAAVYEDGSRCYCSSLYTATNTKGAVRIVHLKEV